MAESDTLLANLIPQITDRVEDAAVAALGYILGESKSSLAALNSLVRTDGVNMPEIVRVQTQVGGGDGTRPDLSGIDKDGNERLLAEAKFWAALTDNQPNAYLNRLPGDGPSVLLFIAPRVRIPALWPELQRRAGKDLGPNVRDESAPNAAVNGTEKRLLLVSWDNLLHGMAERSKAENEPPGIYANIQQLLGLAQRMDAGQFLPLRSEEVRSEIGRRIMNFYNLYIDAIDRVRMPGDEGPISRIGPVTGTWNSNGRYITISGIAGWFGIQYSLWAARGNDDTPLWLQLGGASPDLLNKISAQLGLRASGNYFPILPKTGVERDAVLDDMVSQLKAIAEVIQDAKAESP